MGRMRGGGSIGEWGAGKAAVGYGLSGLGSG